MKIKKLIHKNCGGRIKIRALWGLPGGGTDGEGHCKRCKEEILFKSQIDWKKSKVKDDGQLAYHL